MINTYFDTTGKAAYQQPLDIRAPLMAKLSRGTSLNWLRVATLLGLDSLAIASAWMMAGNWINLPLIFENGNPDILVAIIVITLGIVAASGGYGTDDKRRGFPSLFQSLTLAQGVLLIIGYFYQPKEDIALSAFLLSWGLTLTFTFAERLFVHFAIVALRCQGLVRQPIAIVGKPQDIEKAEKILNPTKQYDIRDRQSLYPEDFVIQNWSKIIARLHDKKVSEVFVCSQLSLKDQISLYWQLKNAGIHLRLLPLGLELPIHWSEIKMVNGMPTLRFSSSPIVGGEFWVKRAFDMVAASIILLLSSPLLVLIAFLIKLDSPGDIFYKQTRIGLKGDCFKVWKFRTMVTNAEHLQKKLECQNEMKGGVMFKMKDDPRITRVGKFLRRYSLDELPQIFNVLRGEMSLVGPRPFPLRDVERFSEHHFMRQEVLPGISGLWQVSGRSDVEDFDSVFRLDMTYIQNWSVYLDLQILLQTVKVVFAKQGAY